jgi:hypothetical protein
MSRARHSSITRRHAIAGIAVGAAGILAAGTFDRRPALAAEPDVEAVSDTATLLNEQVWKGRKLADRIAAAEGYSEERRRELVSQLTGYGFRTTRWDAIDRYGEEDGERIFRAAGRLWAAGMTEARAA